MHHDDKLPIAIPLAELKTRAAEVVALLRSGSLTPDGRESFINVRAALFQRGIFDPVLVRFDSATVPKASAEELAERLETIATSL